MLSLREHAIICCVASRCVRSWPNCMAVKGQNGRHGVRTQDQGQGSRAAHSPVPADSPWGWPPTLLVQLLDADESLHQLRKGGGDGTPALHGLIQLVHLEGWQAPAFSHTHPQGGTPAPPSARADREAPPALSCERVRKRAEGSSTDGT